MINIFPIEKNKEEDGYAHSYWMLTHVILLQQAKILKQKNRLLEESGAATMHMLEKMTVSYFKQSDLVAQVMARPAYRQVLK